MSKQQSSQWKQSASPQPNKVCLSKSQMKTMIITFFYINGIVHFEFIPQGQTVNQAYYGEILKLLHKAVCRKSPELWQLTRHSLSSNSWSINQLLKWNSHPIPLIWLQITCVSKTKVCLKRTNISGYRRYQKKCDDFTESYSRLGVPKIFPTVTASLGKVHSCSRGVLQV
jgi:hypothetical protein